MTLDSSGIPNPSEWKDPTRGVHINQFKAQAHNHIHIHFKISGIFVNGY